MLDAAMHKAKTAHNREHSPNLLREFGFSFAVKNNGARLVVQVAHGAVDFFPGTGLWIDRVSGARGRGVFNFAKRYRPCKKEEDCSRG